jgi:hypothetical protein
MPLYLQKLYDYFNNRNSDKTGFDKFESIEKYSFQLKLPGRPAGQVISFYEETLNVELDRDAIQLAFSFYFFDNGCWNCGNPFHHRPECDREENTRLHFIAKKFHAINHPPSPEELMKKFEKKLKIKNEKIKGTIR